MSRYEKALTFVGTFIGMMAITFIAAGLVILFGRGLIWAWTTLSWEGVVLYLFIALGAPLCLLAAVDDVEATEHRRRVGLDLNRLDDDPRA